MYFRIVMKANVCGLAGIPSEVQRLIYSGRQLENEQTLAHYDVERGALATLIVFTMQ